MCAMAKLLFATGLSFLVAQSCFQVVHGHGAKPAHKRSLLSDAVDYDVEYAGYDSAIAPSSSPPPPPPTTVTEITKSNSTSTTVSENATVPAVVSTIHFTGFANVAAFTTTVKNNFVSAIESPLKAAGYNVQVINVVAASGSLLVTSTTEFLDGSTTGAADFEAALGDSTSVSALFPSSVYGTVFVTSVSMESVTNPSGSPSTEEGSPSPEQESPSPEEASPSPPVSASNISKTVSKSTTVPAVQAVTTFSGFSTPSDFGNAARTNFINTIKASLSSYNVDVAIDNVSAGSIVVTSTTTFLDGSQAGADAFASTIGSSTAASSLFPAATYGTVTSTAKVQSVANANKSSGLSRHWSAVILISSVGILIMS